jgi:hypothetical protein
MIKTLRITTVLAAILSVGFFAFPVVSGVRSDEQAEEFLKSPSAIEKFKANKGATAAPSGSQVSPLVEQAKLFAHYLNPPKPPPPAIAKRLTTPLPSPVKPTGLPPPSTAECKLVGISYFAAQPEMSLALLDITGKGLRWVRQNGSVEHLKVEEVKEDRVIFQGSKGNFELVPQRLPKRSLLKGESAATAAPPFGPSVSPISTVAAGQEIAEPSAAASLPGPAAGTAKSAGSSGRITAPGSRLRPARGKPRPAPSAEELDKFISEVKAEASKEADKAGSGGTGDEADTEALLKFLEAIRVSSDEAEKLDDLGRELDSKRPDPNRPKSRKTAGLGDSSDSNSP